MTFRSQSVASGTTTTTTYSIPKPAGVVVGDVVVVYLRVQIEDTGVNATTFQGVNPVLKTSTDHNYRANYVYVKAITQADIDLGAWTLTYSKSGSTGRYIAICQAHYGIDTANPVLAVSGVSPTDVTLAYREVAQYATSATKGRTIFFAGSEFAASAPHIPTSTPAGYTLLGDSVTPGTDISVSRTYVWIGEKAPSVNPEPAARITWSALSGAWAGSIVLKEGVVVVPPPPPPIGVALKMPDGSTGYLSYLNGLGQRVAPASLKVWKPGFNNVPQLLAKPGATWAHRGGSGNFPEMSEYGYDQSLMRGYGVLEFSASRTSDGVWFGVHDASLDRTSQTTTGLTVANMTWAQVQTYLNSLNAAGFPRPYYKLTDFIDKFGDTHVLVLDPKNGLSQNLEFIAQVNGTGVDRSRLIWKFYGPGSYNADRAQEALNSGWGGTWGYFYETDAARLTDAARSAWTMVGLNWDATQQSWTDMLALGKPVVGHIAATQAQYDSAITKGARMVQCSGVMNIKPISI